MIAAAYASAAGDGACWRATNARQAAPKRTRRAGEARRRSNGLSMFSIQTDARADRRGRPFTPLKCVKEPSH
jgi:hypothetical protein